MPWCGSVVTEKPCPLATAGVHRRRHQITTSPDASSGHVLLRASIGYGTGLPCGIPDSGTNSVLIAIATYFEVVGEESVQSNLYGPRSGISRWSESGGSLGSSPGK